MRMTKWIVLLTLLPSIAWADTYFLPDDIGTGGGQNPIRDCDVPGTTQTIGTVTYLDVVCTGNISLINGNNNFIEFSEPVYWTITGDLDLRGTDINIGGLATEVVLYVQGDLSAGNSGNTVNAQLIVDGSILVGNNTNFDGDLNVSGNVTLGNNSTIEGNVTVDGNLDTGENVTIVGNVTAEDITLGQNNNVEGDLTGDDIVISGGNSTVTGTVTGTGSFTNEGTVDGNVIVNCDDNEGETVVNNGQITGNVNSGCITDNNGDVDGYVNAPDGSDYGNPGGGACDFGVNEEDPCADPSGDVDHFEIVHDGEGLTCLAETITLVPCIDAACSASVAATGTYTLTATDGVNTFTETGSFPSGPATVQLAVSVAGPYTLSLQTSESFVTPNQCDLAGVDNCAINFVDTGFLLSAPTTAQAGVGFNLTVEAIRTDNNTGACVAALDGAQDIELAMTCTNPTTCLQNATTGATTISTAPTFATVSTTFTGGIATLPVEYPDVGAIDFTARKIVATAAELTGSLASDVIVRPFAFVISTEAAADVSAFSADYSISPKYKMAGETFPIAVTAVNAQGGTTPNYGNESPQQRPQLAGTPNYVAPTGAGGAVTLDDNLAFDGSGTGTYSSATARYSDIGVVEFLATHTGGAYLGTADVTGTSVPMGRFYPAYFTASEVVQPTFQPAQDDFTYVGQPLVLSGNFPQLSLAPRSVQGTPVTNYRDDFFKYTPDWSLRSYTHSTTCDAQGPFALTGFGASTATINSGTDTDVNGEFIASLTTEAGLTYVQNPAVYTPPFQACAELTLPAASLTDSDDVCVKTSAAGACLSYVFTPLQGTELLDGRLRLLASYGPANDTLELDFTIEYFDGAGFVNNIRDDSTLYSDAWIQPEATRFQNFVSDESLTAADLEAQTLVATAMNDGTATTLEPLLLGQTAVEGLSGTFDWILNLNDIGLPWLQFNWDDDCSPAISPELNPCAPIEFGVFRGNDRIIYQRELGW